jgi:hypothetical protein
MSVVSDDGKKTHIASVMQPKGLLKTQEHVLRYSFSPGVFLNLLVMEPNKSQSPVV